MNSLPVDAVLPALEAALSAHRAAVLIAPPGSGKTTRAPVALLDAGLAGGRKVVVLQPRRVAARMVARRIAAERGSAPGEEIGWRVRFEDVTSPRTRLEVLTEGLLTRRLQSDPFLEDVGLVVLDEFHERSLHTDLALALLAEAQAARDDLKLLVMSATLDPAPLVAFFGGDCPVIRAEGRPFPVHVRFAPRPDERPLPLRAAQAIQQALREQPNGHVLAFLPGVGEIERTREALAALRLPDDIEILPLHGRLRAAEQDRALSPAPPGTRRVVLSTNIAETSVTLEGVTAVVDSGQQRAPRFDPVLGLERLETEMISAASAEQRAGRAGRTGPGTAWRLWTENEHRLLRPHDPPAIQRADLASAALEILAWGASPHTFGWLQAPPPPLLQRALELLQMLEAIDAAGHITPLGRRLAALPVHPRLGRVILAAHAAGCLQAAATAAALISERDPFARHAAHLTLLERIHHIQQGGAGADPRALQQVRQVRDQLIRVAEQACGRATPATTTAAHEREVVQALIAGFPDRVGLQREPEGRRYLLASGRGVRLDRGLPAPPALIAVELTAGERGVSGEPVVRVCAALDPDILPAVEETVTRFAPARQSVIRERVRRYGALILSAHPDTTTPPAPAEAAHLLAEAAAADLSRALPLSESVQAWLARLRWLAHQRPDLGLPTFDDLGALLPELCLGLRSFAELQRLDLLETLSGRLTWPQQQALRELAPEHWPLPTGATTALQYSPDPAEPPVLAARIQQLFGMTETPRLAGGRVAVRVHLLAPNNRPMQVTDDLAGFWAGSYAEVRKDLRGRYPKHAWPEHPTRADAQDRPRRKPS